MFPETSFASFQIYPKRDKIVGNKKLCPQYFASKNCMSQTAQFLRDSKYISNNLEVLQLLYFHLLFLALI